MNPQLVIAMAVSLAFASLLAVADYCYQAANKLQLELEGEVGTRRGRILDFFTKRPLWVLGTTLVGVMLSIIVFTVSFCMATAHWLPPASAPLARAGVYMFQGAVASIPLLLSIVVLPRMLRVFDPNAVLTRIAVPFFACFVLLVPITWPFLLLSRYINTRLPGNKQDEAKTFLGTPASPLVVPGVDPGENVLDSKMLQRALAFKTVKIRDCMVPRTEITAVELNAPIEQLRDLFVESGHSKVLVYKHDLDDIVGYCHSSSMFRKPTEIREILTPIISSAENNPANDLMIRFIREKKNIAVVMDEFGGTSGVVSTEDIIEEIFGNVDDERDDDDTLVEQQIAPDTFLLSARLEVDHLNETYGWALPAGEYETLNGLILALAGDFPRPGQVIELPPFAFTIRSTGKNRIDQVILTIVRS